MTPVEGITGGPRRKTRSREEGTTTRGTVMRVNREGALVSVWQGEARMARALTRQRKAAGDQQPRHRQQTRGKLFPDKSGTNS